MDDCLNNCGGMGSRDSLEMEVRDLDQKEHEGEKQRRRSTAGARVRAHRPSALRRTCPDTKSVKPKPPPVERPSTSATATAELLRGKSQDQIYKLAIKKLGEEESDLRDRYKHLNLGIQRMNLGNRLRAVSKEASAK